MSDALFNHVFRRIMYMPKCSDVQLNYEINTISDKMTYQLGGISSPYFFWFHLLGICKLHNFYLYNIYVNI